MDDAGDTLGMKVAPVDPGDFGPMTLMESTVSADADELAAWGRRARPVDLSFLAASSRAGSIGRLGDYEVVGLIGRGAVGIVLKALDRGLDRFVALKVQDPALALNVRVRARFLREGRAMAAIDDPNVVTIHKVVVLDRPYLVMEYLPGSLRDRIKGGPPMTPAEALRIGVRITLGLVAAHARGVLHRDIKPANIMIDVEAGKVKLTDFGLAVAGCDGRATASATPDHMAGTPGYMSPEQVRGEALDVRSDLFSLGCVLHALFAGHSPFAREDPDAILDATCNAPPEPTPVPPGCPVAPRVAALIGRLLAKSRADRPGSAREVACELATLLDDAEAADRPAPAAGSAIEPEPEPDTTPILLDPKPAPETPPIEPSAPPAPGHRVGLASWCAIVAAACVLVAVAWLLAASLRPRAGRRGPDRLAWTVGRSPGADFPDLASALARVPPYARLVLVDEGDYSGPFVLDDPGRFAGLIIESRGRARLVAPRGESVVEIRGVPGVVLRGLRIDPGLNQFAVRITGAAEGVMLERVAARSPRESKWTQVFLVDGASGSPGRPIVVRDSVFDVGQGGVTIQGEKGRPVRHVLLEGNRFRGENEQVHVLQAVEGITVTRNLFLGGQALTLNFPEPWGARDVTVMNNSFFRPQTWLHPADSHPNQEAVLIGNNAIFESDDIDAGHQDLARMARGKWLFRSNLWEPGPEAIAPTEGPLAETRPRLEVDSRDPLHPEFLRPAADSELARKGAGAPHPPHVGALPPAVAPALVPSATTARP